MTEPNYRQRVLAGVRAALQAEADRVAEAERAAAPAKPPCGYVNRAGDVTDCEPDHETAEIIRARTEATGGYVNLPMPAGLYWHGRDYTAL